jgi:hypothetical protein
MTRVCAPLFMSGKRIDPIDTPGGLGGPHPPRRSKACGVLAKSEWWKIQLELAFGESATGEARSVLSGETETIAANSENRSSAASPNRA